MAGLAVKLATLMIVVVGVYLDVCQACGECPIYKPPQSPKPPSLPPKVPLPPIKPPKSPKPPGLPPKVPLPPIKVPPTTPTLPKPPSASKPPTCPVALVELSVCSPLLGGIVGGLLPASNQCCALLNLVGLDVEVCLCLAIDANILGLISLNAKVDAVASILTSCGYKVPRHLSCPL